MGYEGGSYHDADKFITAIMKLNTSLEIKAILITCFRSVATLARWHLRTCNFDKRSFSSGEWPHKGLTRPTWQACSMVTSGGNRYLTHETIFQCIRNTSALSDHGQFDRDRSESGWSKRITDMSLAHRRASLTMLPTFHHHDYGKHVGTDYLSIPTRRNLNIKHQISMMKCVQRCYCWSI